MTTPVIVFKRIESITDPFTLECLIELSKRSPLFFASDVDDFSGSAFFENHGLVNSTYLPITTDTPLEVQDIHKGLPSDIVFLLLDAESFVSTISYRTPCVWFNLEDRNIPTSRAIEMIRRASYILSTEEFRENFDIDSRYFREVKSTPIQEIVELCLQAKIRQPDTAFHRLIVADIFTRYFLIEDAFNEMNEDLPRYLRDELQLRFFPQSQDDSLSKFSSGGDDRKGEIIFSYLHSKEQSVDIDSDYKPVGLISHISGLCSSNPPTDLVQLYEIAISTNASEVSHKLIYKAMVKQFLLQPENFLLECPEFFSLLPIADFVSSLSLQEAIEITAIPSVSEEILEEFKSNDSDFVSLVGQLALHQRESQQGIPKTVSEEFSAGIKKIDETALYKNLWVTGLRYWRDMSSAGRNPYSGYFKEPAVIQFDKKYTPNEVAALDRRAKIYLSIGLFGLSCRTFERVRSAAKFNRQFTTELAARLNIGWVHWAQGKSPEIWEPYIGSVLNESGPSRDLAYLRVELDDFLNTRQNFQQDGQQALLSRSDKIRNLSRYLLTVIRKNPILAVPILSTLTLIRKSVRILRRIIGKVLQVLQVRRKLLQIRRNLIERRRKLRQARGLPIVSDAPTNVVATPGVSGEVAVSFVPPLDIGSSIITSYTVTADPGGQSATGGGACMVTGLTNGTAYTFTVVATNDSGDSAPSVASNAATP
ncbi:MAG: fibronectin type III domain-containing protein [Acidimicrobiales bacterium]|nr:fibronectin type III domain-containing protein [Acidimicrobiales bacterium]